MLPVSASQNLPGLVQRAASQLASATSAAEVLEACNAADFAYTVAQATARLAKAKGAHDELIAKAHRAEGDALEIQALAKRRLADEYDAAQKRGEVASIGDNLPSVPERNSKPTAADIGLTRKEIHEARQIRDAEEEDPGIVRRVIDQSLEAGEEPTKAAVRKAISKRRPQLSASGKQLAALRKAWRAASPAVREHFLTEITEAKAA